MSNSQNKMSNSQKVETATATATTITDPLVNSLFGEGAQKNMDKYNRKAAQVMVEKGHSAFIKHCFTHPETGKPMTYAEMRGFYG